MFKFSVFHVACHVLGTWIHCNKVFLVNIYSLHHDVSSYPWLLFVCKSFAEMLETSRNGYVCVDMGAYWDDHIHSLPHTMITWSTNNHFQWKLIFWLIHFILPSENTFLKSFKLSNAMIYCIAQMFGRGKLCDWQITDDSPNFILQFLTMSHICDINVFI